MKRISLAVLIIVLVLSLCACSGKGDTHITDKIYNVSNSSSTPISAAKLKIAEELIPVELYAAQDMLVVENTSVNGADSALYGVYRLSTEELIVPAIYVSIRINGQYILAGGNENMENFYFVYNLNGQKVVGVDSAVALTDIGGGYFSIDNGREKQVYSAEGEGFFFEIGLLTSSYSFSVCGAYLMAVNAESDWIIYNLGSRMRAGSFFSSASERSIYSASYLGGDSFLVIDTATSDSSDYKLEIDGKYYKQTTYIFNAAAAESKPKKISFDYFIYSAVNMYKEGYTSVDRSAFVLKDGFTSLATYVAEGKAATDYVQYYVIDSDMNIVLTMPQGINALQSYVGDYSCIGSASEYIVVLDEDGKISYQSTEGGYRNKSLNDGIITAARYDDSVLKYGAVDVRGHIIVPYQYSALSVYADGYAVGLKDGNCYLVDTEGNEELLYEYSGGIYYWKNFYLTLSGSKVGVSNYYGTALIPATYSGVSSVGTWQGKTYLVMDKLSGADIYVLN